jgi:hypothetical protein
VVISVELFEIAMLLAGFMMLVAGLVIVVTAKLMDFSFVVMLVFKVDGAGSMI